MILPASSIARYIAGAILMAGLVGCGSTSGLEKVIVSGEVTYKGTPVANGDILFYPMEGTKGPMSGASIKDGRYVAEAKGGVPVGEHLVRISAYKVGGSTNTGDMMAPSKDGARVQYLPAKYNEQSVLRLKVDGGSARMIKDFHLSE